MHIVRIYSGSRPFAFFSPSTGWIAFQSDRDTIGAPISVRALGTILRALRAAGRAPRILASFV